MPSARAGTHSASQVLLIRSVLLSAVVFGCALTLLPLFSQEENAVRGPRRSAGEIAREVVRNELNAQDQDRSLWKYRQISEQDGKTQVFEVVETRDGELHRLLSVNGRPLNPKERGNEDRRIQTLLANPEQYREKQNNAAHDAEQARKLLKLLPEAFLYSYDGGRDGELVTLKFRPNPDFHAQTHESEVFHHMEGVMLVDRREHRLAELDGHLMTEVKFWDGLLGHLDKGGTFTVKQRNVGGGHWEITELNVQMSGKALLFKMISVHEKRLDSDFRALPEQTTLRQAEELLAVNADRSQAK